MSDALKTTQRPAWLARAWKIRAVVLALLFGLIAAAVYGQMQASGAAGKAMVPLIWLLAVAAAAGLDWLWLQRNHHRINSWGLSKGRSARNRPL